MGKYAIYSRDELVGYSELESGDPPMGAAFGTFTPSNAYIMIQRECITNHANQSALKLSVRTEAAVIIQCSGVSILDYSAEADSAFIEVNVLGIPSALYEKLFPEQVIAYSRRFN
ncbi:hypothetical protein [Stutzerimonas stutzeri]|uniref:hypothetical protein n=1 Tax=Stutzerimonas stutzeri TaxID=316 RepID=UPI001F2F8C6D|nr:hypothetical protein [Stutzerimonas stutzeri]